MLSDQCAVRSRFVNMYLRDNFLIICVILVSSFYHVLSQRLGFGRCPSYAPVDNFEIQKMTGQWFEVERSFYLLELVSSCTTLNFTAKSEGVLKVAIRTANRWNGRILLNLHGTAKTEGGKGRMMFRIDTNIPPPFERALPGVGIYSILGTDYDNYVVLYSCSNMGIFHADLLWVLSRTRELPVTSRVQVHDVLNVRNIDPGRLTLTNHRNCPLF